MEQHLVGFNLQVAPLKTRVSRPHVTPSLSQWELELSKFIDENFDALDLASSPTNPRDAALMVLRCLNARKYYFSARLYATKSSKASSTPRQKPSPPSPPKPAASGSDRVRDVIRLGFIGAQSILVFHLISSYVAAVCYCEGPSMLPTVPISCSVLIFKWYRRGHGVRVGDVVEFAHPLLPGTGAVKRIIGMPGDFVVADMVNLESSGLELELDVETRQDGSELISQARINKLESQMLQIPEGHCWVLGDNPPDSRDSRYYGPIPLALIRGKVVAQLMPWSERKWLDNGMVRFDE